TSSQEPTGRIGYGTCSVTPGVDPEPVIVDVSLGQDLPVRVVEADSGRAAGDVEVSLVPVGFDPYPAPHSYHPNGIPSPASQAVVTGVTNEKGVTVLNGVPNGHHRVIADRDGTYGWTDVELTANERPEEVVVELPPPSAVILRIKDSNDEI